MKKLSLYIFLVLMWCNVGFALPDCGMNDYKKWTNCFGIVDYSEFDTNDGRIYFGEFGNNPGKRDGIGFSFNLKSESNHSRYIGEYKNDKPFGKGAFLSTDGTPERLTYSTTVNVIPNGFVIDRIPRENFFDRYFGYYKNGFMDGEGTYIYSNGKVTKGVFKKGKLIKDESLKECDRNKSFQTYNNCQLVGGVMHSVDGSKYGDDPKNFKGFIYSGEFQNGKPNGFGLIISQPPNGQKIEYMGEVKNGYRDGIGSLTWIEFGDEHIGNFKNEVPHGEGVIIYYKEIEKGSGVFVRDFARFGSWNNGKEHGKGFVIDEMNNFVWHTEHNNGVKVNN